MGKKKRFGTKGQYIGILQAIYEFHKGARTAHSRITLPNYMEMLSSLEADSKKGKEIALRKLLKQLYKWENVREFLSNKSKGYKLSDYTIWYNREWNQIDRNLMIGRILDKYKVAPIEVDKALGFREGQTEKWLIFNNLLWDEELIEALKEGAKSNSFPGFVKKCKEVLGENKNGIKEPNCCF